MLLDRFKDLVTLSKQRKQEDNVPFSINIDSEYINTDKSRVSLYEENSLFFSFDISVNRINIPLNFHIHKIEDDNYQIYWRCIERYISESLINSNVLPVPRLMYNCFDTGNRLESEKLSFEDYLSEQKSTFDSLSTTMQIIDTLRQLIENDLKNLYDTHEALILKVQEEREEAAEVYSQRRQQFCSLFEDTVKQTFKIEKRSLDDFILEESGKSSMAELRKDEGFNLNFSICVTDFDLVEYQLSNFFSIHYGYYKVINISVKVKNGKINFQVFGSDKSKKYVKELFERQFSLNGIFIEPNKEIQFSDNFSFEFITDGYGEYQSQSLKQIITLLDNLKL